MNQHTTARWVDALCRRGDSAQTVALLKERVARFPDEAWAIELLGRVLIKVGQVDEGIGYLHRATRIQRATSTALAGDDRIDAADLDFLSEEAGEDEAWHFDDFEPKAESASPHAQDAASSSTNEASTSTPDDSEVDRETLGLESSDDPLLEDEDLESLIGDPEEWADADGSVSELDFEAFIWEDDDNDEPVPVEPRVPGSSRILLASRARQFAARLIERAEWNRRDLPLLAEVLEYHLCHHKTLAALDNMLVSQCMSPVELRTVFDLRLYWAESEVFRRGWSRDGVMVAMTWPNISWGLALAVVRYLNTDDLDEVADWLDSCIDDWGHWHAKSYFHPSFLSYLVHLLNHLEEQEAVLGQPLPAYIAFEMFEEEVSDAPGSPIWRSMDDYGLHPKSNDHFANMTIKPTLDHSTVTIK